VGALAERFLDREATALRAAGVRVLRVMPDADDAERMGGNPMDASRTDSVLACARERGRALARGEAAFWTR